MAFGTSAGQDGIDHPLFAIAIDDALKLVRVTRLAVLQPKGVDIYIAALGDVIRRARLRFGKVRLLADLRGSPVRTREAAEALKERNEALYQPGERVALVVESMLLRLQLQRNQVKAHQEIFTDVAAAEAWLAEI